MVRKAFEGYDEPVNIDLDPEEALRIVLQVEPCDDDDSSGESGSVWSLVICLASSRTRWAIRSAGIRTLSMSQNIRGVYQGHCEKRKLPFVSSRRSAATIGVQWNLKFNAQHAF